MVNEQVRNPLDGVDAGVCYDTKSVIVKDKPECVEIPMMMTAFDGGDNDALNRAGYRGRFVLFSVIDAGIRASSTDPYHVDFTQNTLMSAPILDLMIEVREGWQTMGKRGMDWDNVEDGETITVRESR